MFPGETWFAWFPVRVRQRGGFRWAWLESVWRERAISEYGTGPYRYYLF
jgi:hypothetical protein